MGRRLVGPWPGYWAFPGGGVDAGETALEAGLRELFEETSISIADLAPILETIVRIELGERRYEITNFVIEVDERIEGQSSIELEPRWVEIERALELTPMARGTETVVRRVAKLLPSSI
jgi:8-oxo-dGTP diphosphatase